MFTINSVFAIEADTIPHVNKKAIDSFKYDYSYANFHKAFAIAPGGAWSWQANKPTVEEARESALEACSSYTQQPCVLFALDDQVVFDNAGWTKLWRPYKTKLQAKQAEDGVLVGQRFPNIEYTDPNGSKKSIHGLKGKVAFVHFWGHWCPSCRYEFHALIDMYRIINDTLPGEVEFVILQAREPIEKSRQWASENNLDALPLSDSGVKSTDGKMLNIKGGKKIDDRKLASVFPASYVVDKNGVVVFSHMGSVDNWTEYVNFFRDVVEHSGK
ncbi:MAG: TlpA family protein disulfide reductase [Gammaproteobacteria bacterium]|nr:TlpA family protein disulfide reductase [Gammaproteobacteria bacterium]